MPRGKGALKSLTPRNGKNEDTNASVEMKQKEVDQTTSATPEHEGGPSAKQNAELDVGNTSVTSSAQAKKEKPNISPPGKPQRVFVIAGSIIKKDAKPKKDNDAKAPEKIDSNKVEGETKANEADKTPPHDKVDTDSNIKDEECPPIEDNVTPLVTLNLFGDDEHPYEDPSIVVNNSTTLQHKHNKPSDSKGKQLSKNTSEMKHDQRPQGPELSPFTKSTKRHSTPSVMTEHSIARSIFAILVALLLSLIIFLSLFFLLHCHPVLSVVVAVLVFLFIFLVLGFLGMDRLKCLILLFLPSVCSRGGKLALYILVLYFVIKGPLCNTIGNIKSVQSSLTCVNNENFGYSISRTFHAAQNCVDSYQNNSTDTNRTVIKEGLSCLKKMCFSAKEKLKENCASISRKVCHLIEDLSCVKSNQSTISRNTVETCLQPKTNQTYCIREFDGILELVKEKEENHCGFLEVISMFLPLLILLLFYEAYNYEISYQTYNCFHNYFLTGHFQCIDQSRSSCDREAVLPLRKVELRKHVRPATVCQLTDGEKTLICTSLRTYLVFLLIILFIILADLYTFQTFHMESDNQPNVNVPTVVLFMDNTSNVLAEMDKNSTSVGNNTSNPLVKMYMNLTSARDNQTQNTTKPSVPFDTPNELGKICLVRVESPGSISKIVLPILLVIFLVVILMQVYVRRLQWYVCSRFYNDREKERVFYLYNKILEDRVQLVEDCRKRMKCYNREMNTLNSLEPSRIIAHQFKWLSKIFKFFHINLRKCIICNDSEKAAFKICHGADCSGVYCLACSFDIDKKCLYCDTKLKKSLCTRPVDKNLSSKDSLV